MGTRTETYLQFHLKHKQHFQLPARTEVAHPVSQIFKLVLLVASHIPSALINILLADLPYILKCEYILKKKSVSTNKFKEVMLTNVL